MIKEFLDGIQTRIGDFWSGLWAPMFDGWPLWWSWGVFFLILLACLIVGFFLQFKWARAVLGIVVFGAAAWLFGRHTMYNEMKSKLDAERARKAPKPRERDQPADGGFRFPWQ